MGEPTFVSTNGGINFYQGRSHVRAVEFYPPDGSYYIFASPVAAYRGYSFDKSFDIAPYDSGPLYKDGITFMIENPLISIRYSFQHIYDLFFYPTVWPSYSISETYSSIILGANLFFVCLIALPAIYYILRNLRKIIFGKEAILLMPILIILATVVIYYGDPRYRVPFDSFFIIFWSKFFKDFNLK